MPQPDVAFVAHPDAVWSEVDGEVVILDAVQGRYFSAGAVGAYVWRLLSTPHRIEQICAAVHDEFAVSEDVCVADVTEFVESLVASGLAAPAAPA